jgi:hypothetical protein
MQREASANKSGTVKANMAAPEVTLESAAVWGTTATSASAAAKRPDSPAPPPVWTRYIDSRLKQFCTR